MPTVTQVMAELKSKGNPLRVQAFAPHGAPGNLFGVSVADMKVIARKLKGQQTLAYELYETGNGDAMYLAGLVADGSLMTKGRLDAWAKRATWQMISEHTVPGVATASQHARALARKWIDSKRESVASSGWSTYARLVAVTPDDALDLGEIESLLGRVEAEIDAAPGRVRYTMNGFVIAVGGYVLPLKKQAKAVARRLGKVEVDMHGTSCKVPRATEYIEKIEKAGRSGRKRKTVR